MQLIFYGPCVCGGGDRLVGRGWLWKSNEKEANFNFKESFLLTWYCEWFYCCLFVVDLDQEVSAPPFICLLHPSLCTFSPQFTNLTISFAFLPSAHSTLQWSCEWLLLSWPKMPIEERFKLLTTIRPDSVVSMLPRAFKPTSIFSLNF